MKFKHVVLVIFSSFIGASIALYALQSNQKTELPPNVQAVLSSPVQTTSHLNLTSQSIDFTGAASIATPAVVHVKTRYISQINSTSIFEEEFLRNFFGQAPRTGQLQAGASGSGVIISKDGYIVTNNHVIEHSDQINVNLSNNKTYEAILIGRDKDTDLALLKIEEEDLPFLQFANSDSVLVGEWVLAVGNPFNLASTVTAGIVSAKGRNINILENIQGQSNTAIESFIQTDAAINPGNSGGALVNTSGDVIGINTAIATPTGTYAGYAFAVPSNIVAKVVTDLKEYGAVQRAFLGISITSINNDLFQELGLDESRGVYIQGLVEDGAANQGGLQKGDVIIAINDFPVDDVAALQEEISSYRPGNVIEVSFLRRNEVFHATLTLMNRFNNQELLTDEYTSLKN
jgi:serine protease Do